MNSRFWENSFDAVTGFFNQIDCDIWWSWFCIDHSKIGSELDQKPMLLALGISNQMIGTMKYIRWTNY